MAGKKKITRGGKATKPETSAENYSHPEATAALRPDVGTQAQFKKKKPPKTYRYDSSLSPALDWDENPARERGEALIRQILEAKDIEEAKAAAQELKALSGPFLNWAGKAERLSFDVPTLPLFVHERLSTKAIIETLKSHRKDKDQLKQAAFDFFGDPQRSVADQVLKAYEHQDKWTNRMVLGDSLVLMNSLLEYEGMREQVQMIYMDPPYGVKFGSNFQPFVRKRDVKDGDDDNMTREPEMVQAYRDTWELGLHSYLSYLRDRLVLCRELLSPTGSMFLQISDDNVHHVKEIMETIFGSENAISIVSFKKTGSQTSSLLPAVNDYLIWYAKDLSKFKYHQLFEKRIESSEYGTYNWIELLDGSCRRLTLKELKGEDPVPAGKRFRAADLTSQTGGESTRFQIEFEGNTFSPSTTRGWSTNYDGITKLKKANRLISLPSVLCFKRYTDDFPFSPASNFWTDTVIGTFTEKRYVVQTSNLVLQKCILMATNPGDLVLDPSCGSGTTAYVAEQWGRRWITCDVSRVPLALARQRLLTATFDYYELRDEGRGPAGGFVYKRKQNKKGEEVGGIVPHVTLKSIANNEPPEEEVLVDRPEKVSGIVRVTGPFSFEATIPSPMDYESEATSEEETHEELNSYASFVERMIEVLRKSPVLQVEGGRKVTLKNVRPPGKSLSLSAEATVPGSDIASRPDLGELVQEAIEASGKSLPFSEKAVAIVFGPENGAVSERLVYEAAREAHAKGYAHLFVIGFAIQPNARELIGKCEEVGLLPATYIQATPDILMGDLLKNMRSSQIFSVCGQPEVKVKKAKDQYQVELVGLDVFDPTTMEVQSRKGDDVPAWFLDTDYNGLCFHVCQAFFPRTGAWESLKKALRATHEESVWDHLAGTTSAPFDPGEHKQVAVKVIDDRGNELLVVKEINKEANYGR